MTRTLLVIVCWTVVCFVGGCAITGLVATDPAGPVANQDHWRIPYGIWTCDMNDGTGGWLPPFESTDDPVGIHSHDDGVISIHPFSTEAAGEQAVAGLFFLSMRAELSDSAIVLDDGTVLGEDESCVDGSDPTIHLRRWDLEGTPLEIITEDLAATRFTSSDQIWAFVHAPLDAEVPPLPLARLEADWR